VEFQKFSPPRTALQKEGKAPKRRGKEGKNMLRRAGSRGFLVAALLLFFYSVESPSNEIKQFQKE